MRRSQRISSSRSPRHAYTAAAHAFADRTIDATWIRVSSVAIIIVTIVFALQYPLLPWADQLVDQGKISEYRWYWLVSFVLGLTVWFAAYAVLVFKARGQTWRSLSRLTIGSMVVQLGAMALMYPTNAIDVFIYAARSHLWTRWGENPSATVPLDFWERDTFVHFASQQWADDVSPYGPLWNHIAWPITTIADGNILVALIGFKVLAIICVVASTLCVHGIVRIWAPDRAMQAALLWLLNPLVLWEGVANAHNDLVIATIVLMALLAWVRGWLGWVLPLLAASILVKYVTVVLVPLAIVGIWSRLRDTHAFIATMFSSAIVSALLLVASLAPFTDLPAVIRALEDQGSRRSRSPLAMTIATASRVGITGERVADLLQTGAWICVAIVLGVALHRVYRDPDYLPRAWFDVLFVTLIVATPNLRPWYLIWLVGLVAVLPFGFPALRTITWTASSLLAYCHYIWGFEYLDLPRYWYDLTGVAIALLPVVGVMLWEYVSGPKRAGERPRFPVRERYSSPR